MSRILFLPDDLAYLMLESGQPPEELATAINAGLWKLLPDFLDWLKSHGIQASHIRLCASCHGSLVIITPNRALEKSLGSRVFLPNSNLTRRQRQVLHGLMEGHTTKEIAIQLGIQPRTVYMHVAQLKKRFNTKSRVHSIRKATTAKLIPLHRKE